MTRLLMRIPPTFPTDIGIAARHEPHCRHVAEVAWAAVYQELLDSRR
jgi:hypothetical protein